MTDEVVKEKSEEKECDACRMWAYVIGFLAFGIVVGTTSGSGTVGFWSPVALFGLLLFIETQVNKFVRKDN